MNLEPTSEQHLLRDTVRALLADVMPVEAVQRYAEEPGTIDDGALWHQLAELGLTGILVPERYGGAGLGFADVALVLEELGSGLAPSGLAASAVISAALLLACPPDKPAHLLPRLASGALRVAAAFDGRVTAEPAGDRYLLNGVVPFVLEAEAARLVLVEATLGEVPAVFAVDAGELACERVTAIDATRRFSNVRLESVPVSSDNILAAGEAASRALTTGKEATMLATACESVGGAGFAFDLANAYAKVREQFGAKIGSFQAIKHLLVDNFLALKNARAAVRYAAVAWDAGASDRTLAIRVAKVLACQTYLQAAGDSIQVHGGIGFTKELPLHLHIRRAKMNEALGGSTADHLTEIGARLEEALAG